MNLLSRDQTHFFWKTIRFIPKKEPYAAIKGQFARFSWHIWCFFWTYVTVLRLLLPVQSWVSMNATLSVDPSSPIKPTCAKRFLSTYCHVPKEFY